MPTPRVLILRAPGTNCDQETAFAFEQSGGQADVHHINRLLENPSMCKDYQILCIPGGFSYGDDVAAGRIFGNQIRHHLNEAMAEFKATEKLVLGICNGFQILLKSGLLLPDDASGPSATLAWNDSGRYEDRWVQLKNDGDKCVFLRDTTSLYLPIAHAEGKFVPRDDSTLASLAANGQLPLRYTGQPNDVRPVGGDRPKTQAIADSGQVAYPENPNGSIANVAGVCDETGRVFGLMPHPERYLDLTHHPRWTRGGLPEKGDGVQIFENAVSYFG